MAAEILEHALRTSAGNMRGVFYLFSEWLTFDMLKRISHAVGAFELVPTHREVLKANPTNAFKLVDASVKLDSVKFPTKDVLALKDDFKRSVFCGRLLKNLVVHHLYLFPTEYRIKAKICNALDIPIQTVEAKDAARPTHKRLPPSAG
jgi:hypothetical protein